MKKNSNVTMLVAGIAFAILALIVVAANAPIRAHAAELGGIGTLPNDMPAAGEFFLPDGNGGTTTPSDTKPSTPSGSTAVDQGSGIDTPTPVPQNDSQAGGTSDSPQNQTDDSGSVKPDAGKTDGSDKTSQADVDKASQTDTGKADSDTQGGSDKSDAEKSDTDSKADDKSGSDGKSETDDKSETGDKSGEVEIIDDPHPTLTPEQMAEIDAERERQEAEEKDRAEREKLLRDLVAGDVAQAIVNKYQSAIVNDSVGTKLSFWTDDTVTVEDANLGSARVSATVFGAGCIYRMYNPNSGEHFYTKNPQERDMLESVGWDYEPQIAIAPAFDDEGARPVYRVYNPNSGLHHYTMGAGEVAALKVAGWKYEGISFYAFMPDNEVGSPVYRLYCPFPDAHGQNQHVYTLLIEEKIYLVRLGYQDEGICWRIRK